MREKIKTEEPGECPLFAPMIGLSIAKLSAGCAKLGNRSRWQVGWLFGKEGRLVQATIGWKRGTAWASGKACVSRACEIALLVGVGRAVLCKIALLVGARGGPLCKTGLLVGIFRLEAPTRRPILHKPGGQVPTRRAISHNLGSWAPTRSPVLHKRGAGPRDAGAYSRYLLCDAFTFFWLTMA